MIHFVSIVRSMKQSKVPLFLSFLLSGCSIGPNYERPEMELPKQWSIPSDKVQKNNDLWWKNYQDPVLNNLVEQALAANFDLQIAVEKIKETRAGYDAQLTNWLPTIGLGSSVQRDRNVFPVFGLKKPYDTWKAGYDTTWEIDIFGGNRRLIEAAEAQAIGAEWGLKAAQQIIVSEVIRTYFQYQEFKELSKITAETTANQEETARLISLKLKAGGSSVFDNHRAVAQAYATAADAPKYATAAEQARQKLMVLLGEKPDLTRLDTTVPCLENLKLELDSPLGIIRSRPDVIIAEQELAAATYMTGVAISQMYPKISIQGFLGQMSTLQSNLMESTNKSFTIAGGLYLPLFSFGRLQKQVDAADARQQQALFNYKKTVLSAIAEIETLSVAFNNEQKRYTQLKLATENAGHARNIAKRQYEEGLISLFETLEVERTFYGLQSHLAESKANLGITYSDLQKALGRGRGGS